MLYTGLSPKQYISCLRAWSGNVNWTVLAFSNFSISCSLTIWFTPNNGFTTLYFPNILIPFSYVSFLIVTFMTDTLRPCFIALGYKYKPFWVLPKVESHCQERSMQQCPAMQRIWLPKSGGLSSCHSCDINLWYRCHPFIHWTIVYWVSTAFLTLLSGCSNKPCFLSSWISQSMKTMNKKQ